MTVVVGFGPELRSNAGLHLAGRLARALGEPLVLCCVVHDSFDTPALRDAYGVDDDWRKHLRASADEALRLAREALPDDVEVQTVVRTGRSVPQTLQQEGTDRQARILVVGSATVGNVGRISLGSTSDRLLHSSPLPVALAPRGYRQGGPLERLLLAVEPTRGDQALAGPAAELAGELGVGIEVVTLAVRGPRTALGAFADQGVYDAWRSQVTDAHETLAATLTAGGATVLGTRLVEGDRWSTTMDALDWDAGDLMLVGSSRMGPLAGVFLGSTAARIIRHSPVPVVVLPRV